MTPERYIEDYLEETIQIARTVDRAALLAGLDRLRRRAAGCSSWGSAAAPAMPRTR